MICCLFCHHILLRARMIPGREESAYLRTAGVEGSLYFTLNGNGTMIKAVPHTYDSASHMAATTGSFPVHILCAWMPW